MEKNENKITETTDPKVLKILEIIKERPDRKKSDVKDGVDLVSLAKDLTKRRQNKLKNN